MLDTPESRARLRRKLEMCPDDRPSPVSINAGLELLEMVERQERMISWLIERIGDFCDEQYEYCDDCPVQWHCGNDSSKESWREAARKAVEGK